jgi:hypothetical protein
MGGLDGMPADEELSKSFRTEKMAPRHGDISLLEEDKSMT